MSRDDGYGLGDMKRLQGVGDALPGGALLMRDVVNGRNAELPPRMPAAMSKDDMWQAIEGVTRCMGEAQRRGVAVDVYERLDVARGLMLAMFSVGA